jgi:hypothetical protein
MRAMILLVLLLALLALFSLHEPILPFWKERFPAVMACLDEGRYHDALAAALAPDPPGKKSERWSKSEPFGEAAPQDAAADDPDSTSRDDAPAHPDSTR